MSLRRISASSYSNTAPLVWSFLYGKYRGHLEVIMDTAPARSAELLAQDRVDAALVPVIAFQTIPGAKLIPNVCVGAVERVRSVCLITRGIELKNVDSVALDTSSRTSVILTKIIFREFLGREPMWIDMPPDLNAMLATADAALLIGDPALALSAAPGEARVFDIAELWHRHTQLGFVFAMWMTLRGNCDIPFAAARDEGLEHIDEISSNYESDIGLSHTEMDQYLTENIVYEPNELMLRGMDLYFELAHHHGLIDMRRAIEYV